MYKIMTINDLFHRSDFLIIGHRGAAGLAPENTMDSFRLAIELGCPLLELDVQRIYSEDGTPRLVVFHDDTVDRTTNAKGLIAGFSVEALNKVRCTNDLPIPMLEDVIVLLAEHPNVGLNIELKSKETAGLIAQTIQANPHIPVLISSFHHDELAQFRQLDNATPVAPLFARWREDINDIATNLDASAINIAATSVSAMRMQILLESKLPVFAYTVNAPSKAEKLRQLGLRGIFTDRPDKFDLYLLN